MADGGVYIDVGMNVNKAERDLERLKQKIAKVEQEISKNSEKKSFLNASFADVGAKLDEATMKVRALREEYSRARGDEKEGLKLQLTEAIEEQRVLNSEANRLNREYEAAGKKIETDTSKLADMKEEAGALEKSLEETQRSGLDKMAEGFNDVTKSIRNGVKSILKWGFGIRSVFILARRLRSALKEGINAYAEQDATTKATLDNLKNSLTSLKAAWGAAFAPVLNAVAPILDSLVDKLIEAANAVQMFFAYLNNAGTYNRIVRKAEATANAYEQTASAAGDAKKALMGFDEINRLDAGGGGGGGGSGSSPWSVVETAIDGFGDGFLSQLVLDLGDIMFNWDNLNPEQIAKKVTTGLTALLFGAIGATFAGTGGFIVMSLIGVIASVFLNDAIFNNDGKIGPGEVGNMIAKAMTALVGGVLGFAWTGNMAGALVGAAIGLALSVGIQKIIELGGGAQEGDKIIAYIGNALFGAAAGAFLGFEISKSVLGAGVGAVVGLAIGIAVTWGVQSLKRKQEALDRFYATQLGQDVARIQKETEEALSFDADLKVRIASITGEIDEQTQADFAMAAGLIDQIFTLDANETKTSAEIELINRLIEELNGLGLSGLEVAFDESTGHVTQTKDEVTALYNEILKQYQIEALKGAYTEAYAAEFDALRQVEAQTERTTQAYANLQEARQNAATKQFELNAAQSRLDNAVVDLNVTQEEYAELERAVKAAKDALVDANIGVSEAQSKYTEAGQALEQFMGSYDDAASTLDSIIEAYTEKTAEISGLGDDVQEGLATSIRENSHPADEATKAAQAVLDAYKDTLQTHSRSEATYEIGEYVMEGLEDGIESKTQEVISSTQSALGEILKAVEEQAGGQKTL